MADKKLKLEEKTTVYGTGKDAENMPKGKEVQVHPELAKKLIAKGVVDTKKP